MRTLSRLLKPPADSFFLFGPRGVGKTTWAQKHFSESLRIDLLDSQLFLRLSKEPALLSAIIGNLPENSWICIDEIQRVPMLLNEVQRLMTQKALRFVLTGSSARKLKRQGANLLGGRALVANMEGLSCAELGDSTNIDSLITTGTLPLVINKPDLAKDILDAYLSTYIKEEIREEGIIRKVEPFLRFIEIAGAMNAQKVNHQNIARDAMVPASNVQNYFSILVDTLIGHFLPAYRPALKIREVSHPKFYWFDPGVARAAAGMMREEIEPVSLGYALETLIYHELRVFNQTHNKHRNIYFYETGAGAEIDFVIETRKKTHSQKASLVCIEVKNSKTWNSSWESAIRSVQKENRVIVEKAVGIYRGHERLEFENFTVYPVEQFMKLLYHGGIF